MFGAGAGAKVGITSGFHSRCCFVTVLRCFNLARLAGSGGAVERPTPRELMMDRRWRQMEKQRCTFDAGYEVR